MGRVRTTSCGAEHYGASCQACALERKRRSRAGGVVDGPRTFDDVQRDEIRASAYVDAYVRRDAIVADGLCVRCEHHDLPSPTLGLVAFHPDPAKRRDIVWLCPPCRRMVRATREVLTSSWLWPGGLGVSPKKTKHTVDLLSGITLEVRERLPNASSFVLSEVVVGLFFERLDIQRLQGFLAQGVRLGAQWSPVVDPAMNEAFRRWLLLEIRRISEASRTSRLFTVKAIPLRERPVKQKIKTFEDAIQPSPQPKVVLSSVEDADSRLEAIFRRMDEADAMADAINARIGLLQQRKRDL